MDLNEMQGKLKVTVVEYLKKLKEEAGEDIWKTETRKLALQAFQIGGEHEIFWRELIKDYDWINADDLKKEAEAKLPSGGGIPGGMPGGLDMNQLIAQAMKTRMPALKTQAQFTTFRAAFDAFEAVVNSIFMEDATKEAEFRKVLETAFTACKQATELTRKLEAVPEASVSKAAEEFKKPPAEFAEYDVQRGLLEELSAITDYDLLQTWYTSTKARRDAVKSQTLRNVLIDAIRNRNMELKAKNPS